MNELDEFETYIEPTYPLTITELFDEDNIKLLLTDEYFAKQDRTKLALYNKHRLSGSKVLVQYCLSSGCEEYQLGRLYAKDGLGLQSFRNDIRNPLSKKYYWDIDMENAHYRIAEWWCKKYDLPHIHITNYIDNRDGWLEQVSCNRKKAKTEFLKICYGGNIQLYNEFYTEIDGEITQTGYTFLEKVKQEFQVLMDKLWETHSHLHKIKVGKDKTQLCKKDNKKASLASLLFSTDERKLIVFLKYILETKYNRKVGRLIHDGTHIEKLDTGETQFPVEIMDECSAIMFKKYSIRVKLTQKPIDYEWTPSSPKLTEYETRKMEFEKNHFFIGSQIVSILSNGELEYTKPSDIKTRMRCNNYMQYNPEKDKNEKKYFFDEWLDDPNRAKYERLDFIPDIENCPKNVFNLFKGFKAEKFKPDVLPTQEEEEKYIEPIITHLNYLTSRNPEYLIKWLAKKIQRPNKKAEVGILIRDIGGLFDEGGGTGKNYWFEWFGNEIIGDDYTYIIQDNRELYGDFNSQFQGKLLIIVEEASSGENHKNNDILKAKITSKKQNVNKKCVASYSVNDFADYIFFSNNRNPLPIKQGNRRLAVFDADTSMRGNVEYFKDLSKKLNDPLVKWCFYSYLKRRETFECPIDFQVSIPLTSAYIELRMLNAPLILKWICYLVRQGIFEDKPSIELYSNFKNWVSINKESSADNIPTQTAFGLMLNGETLKYQNPSYNFDNSLVDKHKTKGSMKCVWCIDNVVDGLKKLHLLSDDFIYVEKMCVDDNK